MTQALQRAGGFGRPLMAVKDIRCARGGAPLFRSVRFTVRTGDALMVLGPNGVGKSTLLSALAGLFPHRGHKRFAKGAEYSFLGDRLALNAALTVGQHLKFWERGLGADASPYIGGVSPNMRVGNLSQGQQQILAMARVVAEQRNLWLLDEPTRHLDARRFKLFVKWARQHLEDGGGIIWTSPLFDEDMVEALDARVLRLEEA